jgi:polysaccharide export outer membrane protein
VSGCGSTGPFVWFQQAKADLGPVANEYVIGVGDVVSVKVLGHDEMAVHERVRSDGRVALLLIGEIDVKAKRPSSVKAELEARLKDYIVSPSVVVNVDEVAPMTVLLLGEVAHPGAIALDTNPNLVHAIAMGGGLTDYASRSGIYVVRTEPRPIRIRFNYEDIVRNNGGAGEFILHRNDVIEVE